MPHLESRGHNRDDRPDLGRMKLGYAAIASTVTKGKTGKLGTMPPFKGNLTAKQIQNVAAFVYTSTH